MRSELKTIYDFTGKTILVADDLCINFLLLNAFMGCQNLYLMRLQNIFSQDYKIFRII